MIICIAYACRCIWKISCEIVIGSKEVDGYSAIYRIKAAVSELFHIKEGRIQDDMSEQQDKSLAKWSLPEDGWIKINCDGAFDPQTKNAGTGITEGRVVDVTNRRFQAENASIAEAMAFKGANLAVEKKFQKVIMEMETDSKEIHSILVNK